MGMGQEARGKSKMQHSGYGGQSADDSFLKYRVKVVI
jgi:hypothetical protein